MARARPGATFRWAAALPLGLAAACASAPTVSDASASEVAHVDHVFLAPLLVEYVDARTGAVIPPPEGAADGSLRETLARELRTGMERKRLPVSERGSFPGLDGRIVDGLAPLHRTIRLGASPAGAEQERLSSLSRGTGASHLMLCRCRPHVGPAGYWNPLSGAMASGASRLVLDCHLYDLDGRRVAWTRTAQVRETADDAPTLAGLASLMLQTLQVRRPGGRP